MTFIGKSTSEGSVEDICFQLFQHKVLVIYMNYDILESALVLLLCSLYFFILGSDVVFRFILNLLLDIVIFILIIAVIILLFLSLWRFNSEDILIDWLLFLHGSEGQALSLITLVLVLTFNWVTLLQMIGWGSWAIAILSWDFLIGFHLTLSRQVCLLLLVLLLLLVWLKLFEKCIVLILLFLFFILIIIFIVWVSIIVIVFWALNSSLINTRFSIIFSFAKLELSRWMKGWLITRWNRWRDVPWIAVVSPHAHVHIHIVVLLISHDV